jgi:hypothetical protein
MKKGAYKPTVDDYERAAYTGLATALFAFLFAGLPKLIYWVGFALGRIFRLLKDSARDAANRGG